MTSKFCAMLFILARSLSLVVPLLPNQFLCLRKMQTISLCSLIFIIYLQIFRFEQNLHLKNRMRGESDRWKWSRYWASRKLSGWDNKSKEVSYQTSKFTVCIQDFHWHWWMCCALGICSPSNSHHFTGTNGSIFDIESWILRDCTGDLSTHQATW